MGKVRTVTIGDEATEAKQKLEAEKRREAKKVAKSEKAEEPEDKMEEKKTEKKMVKKQEVKTKVRSSRYAEGKKMLDKAKSYLLSEALDLVLSFPKAKFDETVELHINTLDKGVNGSVVLPHGTGKETKIAILAPSKDPKGAEDLLKSIELGKIDFDVLIATPDAMPKLAKVARVLGPKGLMPNPKNGTVSPNPEEVAKKFAGGQVNFKSEAKANIIHVSVGKVSFGKEKLTANIKTLLSSIENGKVRNTYLKSTMSPSVKLTK